MKKRFDHVGDAIARLEKASDEHKRLYPEQYAHPLVGKRIRDAHGHEGVVLRVMQTRFGPLASLDSLDSKEAVSIAGVTILS